MKKQRRKEKIRKENERKEKKKQRKKTKRKVGVMLVDINMTAHLKTIFWHQAWHSRARLAHSPCWPHFGAKFCLLRSRWSLFEKLFGLFVAILGLYWVSLGHFGTKPGFPGPCIWQPGAHISRASWGDVGINSYVEGCWTILTHVDARSSAKMIAPQQDQCCHGLFVAILAPSLNPSFGL